MAAVFPSSESGEEPAQGRRHVFRVASLVVWGVVLAVQTVSTVRHPGLANVVAEAGFLVLFFLVNLQLLVMRWVGRKNWRRITSRLHGTAYLNEKHDLPNRNYILAELRREMPRARSTNSPFVLIQISLDNLNEVRQRRGDDFAERTLKALADTLKRLTRSSDFLAHSGDSRFCVMLVDCNADQSSVYLRRVPGTIYVSDGRQMFDVPVVARVYEYDMEALYATDVLREVEETPPLRRREAPRPNAYVA